MLISRTRRPYPHHVTTPATALHRRKDEALPAGDFLREELPYPAGFLAGKAYVAYRRQGGTKRSPIADLYLGAHAAVCGYRLLTRDGERYRTYFPKLELITPSG
ncbi:hypothetical protein Jiend_08750 [Micromonospora endophytica]|nr:hypothetical protein Jiend_08750 [Micromonospora endophytica]